MKGLWVEIARGEVVESRHGVHLAVVDARGELVAAAGDAAFMTFARSAIKSLQAIPLIEDGVADRYGLSDAELALCCASHGGEDFHLAAAASILAKIGETESSLACGAHAPYHKPSARALREAGEVPGRLHNNCSGKHAGMLALARAHGWEVAGYHEASHPVQRRMLEETSRWTGIALAAIATGVDGCGVLTFGVPLSALALAFARLGAAAAQGEVGPARIVAAMLRHPEYVAGTDRLCTDLMRVAGGRIIAKMGAEGVYCAGVPGAGLGIALKVEDGARRASEPALLGVLRALELLSAAEYDALLRYAEPVQYNTRGEEVGRLRPVVGEEVGGCVRS
jgi:L-asparaginase II